MTAPEDDAITNDTPKEVVKLYVAVVDEERRAPTPVVHPFPAPKSESFHLTELGNARRLVAQFGDDICYVPSWKSWLVWDGQRWVRDQTGEIVRHGMYFSFNLEFKNCFTFFCKTFLWMEL